MNWKKMISISMSFLLTGGLVFQLQIPMISDAKSIYESNSDLSTSIYTFQTLDSYENDASGRSSAESTTASHESTEKDKGSDSSTHSTTESTESSTSDSSDHSGNGGNSDSSEKPSDSSSENSDNKEDSSSSSESSDNKDSSISDSVDHKDSEETEEKKENSSDKDKKKKEEKKEKKPEKKVVKDDSNGRDYQESEIISSGNTSFTIVSVVREDKALEKKLKELKEKKKTLEKELVVYEHSLSSYSTEIEDIQNIYNMFYQEDLSLNENSLYLTGYKKDCSFYENPSCIKGMDAALYDLARKYNYKPLLSWLKTYSTERSPFPNGYLPIDGDSDLFSSADSLLQEMLLPCSNWIVENQASIDERLNSLEDTKEHIEKLEAAKAASAIEIDSRLVEYKDKIPDQCVEFLNSIVAKEGTPYVWGASGPNSFDCSGLVSYGLRQCNAVSSGFRWTSIDFATQLRSIPFSEALPGDLVWKKGHIAVYIDENTVFEAPYTGAHIRFTSCNVSSRFSRVLRWWTE